MAMRVLPRLGPCGVASIRCHVSRRHPELIADWATEGAHDRPEARVPLPVVGPLELLDDGSCQHGAMAEYTPEHGLLGLPGLGAFDDGHSGLLGIEGADGQRCIGPSVPRLEAIEVPVDHQ